MVDFVFIFDHKNHKEADVTEALVEYNFTHPVYYDQGYFIKLNPFIGKPLTGPLKGKRSVRINIQHRIFYTFDTNIIVLDSMEYEGTINVLQAFGHDYK